MNKNAFQINVLSEFLEIPNAQIIFGNCRGESKHKTNH